MFQLLDQTLRKMLDYSSPNPITGLDDKFIDAEISFDTPEKGNITELKTKNTINLFLYEVKENRELRQPAPSRTLNNGRSFSRRAPLRVDCTYMVTAWADKSGSAGVTYEHRLLGQTFNWLSRFPIIPEQFLLAAGMTGQVFAPPTMVAQMDGAKSAGEFWSALGIPPRPYFNLIVTICMDLDQAVEDSIVTTMSSRYLQTGEPSSEEEILLIGGTVMDNAGKPVPNAWVLMEPYDPVRDNEIKVTDKDGHFVFKKTVRGVGFSLRVRASGYPETPPRQFDVVPSATGEYDLQFP